MLMGATQVVGTGSGRRIYIMEMGKCYKEEAFPPRVSHPMPSTPLAAFKKEGQTEINQSSERLKNRFKNQSQTN